jgi:hypothetical protein
LKLLGDLLTICRFDRSQSFPDYLKVLVISKFMDEDAIDINEETKTHQAFLTPQGPIPFDFYNVFYRNNIIPKYNFKEGGSHPQ